MPDEPLAARRSAASPEGLGAEPRIATALASSREYVAPMRSTSSRSAFSPSPAALRAATSLSQTSSGIRSFLCISSASLDAASGKVTARSAQTFICSGVRDPAGAMRSLTSISAGLAGVRIDGAGE